MIVKYSSQHLHIKKIATTFVARIKDQVIRDSEKIEKVVH
jgi:hypothetical protein